jgi:uncharacterized protein YfaS (alpha-2-macroglobulin family)
LTYPNVLVLDYLKSTNQSTPELEMKAEEYINLGYQRLVVFEVDGGGFSLYGDPPARLFLSAYGLMEISDMAKVYPVDEAMIERTARWLAQQQAGDGSWSSEDYRVAGQQLATTAYVTWALAESDVADEAALDKGITYLKEHYTEVKDGYVLALVANALVAWDPSTGSGQGPGDSFTKKVLDDLVSQAMEDDPSTGSGQGGAVYWQSGVESFMGAKSQMGSIETTAMAAYALLKGDAHPDVANKALTYLVRNKDSFGTWSTTQATILSLKALIESAKAGEPTENVTVRVSLNGEEADPIQVTPENFDVVQLVAFTDRAVEGENMVRIEVEGKGNMMYQVTTRYYVPWELVPPEEKEAMTIDVRYDRTDLQVDDTVRVDVTARLNLEGTAKMVVLDLGIPPGFEVEAEDLSARVQQDLQKGEEYPGATVKRFDLTGRQIIVYLQNLSYREPISFHYGLRAKYPLRVKTPASTAYDYYNPEQVGVAQPEVVAVE